MLRDAVRGVAELLPQGKKISLNGKIHDVPPKILAPVLENFFKQNN
jgi:hypothetical protein